MRKTVTITIAEQLFHIEEKAYKELEGYLDSIRTYFAGSTDRDERCR